MTRREGGTEAVAPVGFEIDLPPHWTTRRDVAPFALVAHAFDRRPRSGFVANLTVLDTISRTEAEGGATSFDRYAAAQLEAIARSLHEALLVTAERSAGGGSTSVLDLLVAHDVNGVAVTLRQRHLLPYRGRALVVSASVADVDWPDLAVDCSRAVRSLRTVPS